MHASQILRQFIGEAVPQMHQARQNVLIDAVTSAVLGSALAVTSLGRGLSGHALEKHRIKRMDRLLSNSHLFGERIAFYRWHAQRVLGNSARPLISVDWSNLDLAKQQFLLRASVAVDGRAMTVYEEVHPRSRYNKASTHRAFLGQLSRIICAEMCPLVVTDAGFQNAWFKQVCALGWDFIGRVRGRVMYSPVETDQWVHVKSLHPSARRQPCCVGTRRLSRATPLTCQLVVMRKPRRGRHQHTWAGKRARAHAANEQARGQREPWVLATSVDVSAIGAKRITRAYATRMQIEEAFRDLKSVRFGLGFDAGRPRSIARIALLLLIALLALLLAWWVGNTAQALGQNKHYQANTIRKRRVLSTTYLGRRVILNPRFHFSRQHYQDAGIALQHTVREHAAGL